MTGFAILQNESWMAINVRSGPEADSHFLPSGHKMWRAQVMNAVLTALAVLFLRAADGRPVYSAMWGEQVRLHALLFVLRRLRGACKRARI